MPVLFGRHRSQPRYLVCRSGCRIELWHRHRVQSSHRTLACSDDKLCIVVECRGRRSSGQNLILVAEVDPQPASPPTALLHSDGEPQRRAHGGRLLQLSGGFRRPAYLRHVPPAHKHKHAALDQLFRAGTALRLPDPAIGHRRPFTVLSKISLLLAADSHTRPRRQADLPIPRDRTH